MTYFELINYLNSVKNSSITSETIDYLNNIDIHFTSQKYVRFLNHLEELIEYRLGKIYTSFIDKMTLSYLNDDALSIEIDVIKNELKMLVACSKLNAIKPSSQKEIESEIIKLNNDLVHQIVVLFEENQKEIFLSLLLKEEA